MRFAFSTNAFMGQTVLEAIESIAAAGYDGVELLADIPHLYAASVGASEVRRLRRALSRHRLGVSNINANTVRGYCWDCSADPLFEPCLTDPDPEARAWRVDYTKKCVDLAAGLESPSVSITSGPIQPESTPEEGIELLKRALREIAAHAGKRGVKVGLEYGPGLLIESGTELSCLINEIGSEHLGACLDLGHSRLVGEDPEFTIDLLRGCIFHIRVEDMKDGKRHHLIPGTGDMDFSRLLAAVEKSGYEGFVTVELYAYPHRPEEAARRSLEYLRGLGGGRRAVGDAAN